MFVYWCIYLFDASALDILHVIMHIIGSILLDHVFTCVRPVAWSLVAQRATDPLSNLVFCSSCSVYGKYSN